MLRNSALQPLSATFSHKVSECTSCRKKWLKSNLTVLKWDISIGLGIEFNTGAQKD